MPSSPSCHVRSAGSPRTVAPKVRPAKSAPPRPPLAPSALPSPPFLPARLSVWPVYHARFFWPARGRDAKDGTVPCLPEARFARSVRPRSGDGWDVSVAEECAAPVGRWHQPCRTAGSDGGADRWADVARRGGGLDRARVLRGGGARCAGGAPIPVRA